MGYGFGNSDRNIDMGMHFDMGMHYASIMVN